MSLAHWLALASVQGIGGATMALLLERFGDVESIWEADEEELVAIPRVTPAVVERLRAVSLEALEEELVTLSDEGLGVLTWEDDDYPSSLRDIASSPPILFTMGELLPEDAEAVAVVGTRQASPRGTHDARQVARELAERRLTVVSGLAIGVDTAAHQGALEAEDGRTLAVLGSGVRSIHPRSNVELAAAISSRGAVLSELHPNTRVRGNQLMARDRLISGLAKAVIVVEASEESGSVDTARRAVKQRRWLLAVPGSPGTDMLLEEGAEPLTPRDADWDALVQRIRAFELPRPQPTEPASTQLSLL